MYQPLTGRARYVMQAANQEALRFNHEHIETEHLLLAIIVEGRGVAANVLRHFTHDLRQLRLEIETLMKVGPCTLPRGTRLPRTTHVVNVSRFAMEEAHYLVHNYVGTEHFLLGLIREDEGLAAQILMGHGLELHAVRKQVVNLLESGLRRGMPILQPPFREVEDIPPQLNAALSELNADIGHMTKEKWQAVSEEDFEKAVFLRDAADKIKRRKTAMIADWLARQPVDSAWLAWGGGAVLKLDRRRHSVRGALFDMEVVSVK